MGSSARRYEGSTADSGAGHREDLAADCGTSHRKGVTFDLRARHCEGPIADSRGAAARASEEADFARCSAEAQHRRYQR
jgi:hypothetical protein